MKEFLRTLIARATPAGAWLWWLSLAAVLFLSTAPGMGPPERFGLDKVAHFSAYAWLALLTALTLRGRTARWAGVALVCTALGTELAQSLVDGRSAMVADAAASVAGLVAGTALAAVISRALRRKPPLSAGQ